MDVDPAAEETKGGAGHVAKALFSYGSDRVGVVVYVPEELKVASVAPMRGVYVSMFLRFNLTKGLREHW